MTKSKWQIECPRCQRIISLSYEMSFNRQFGFCWSDECIQSERENRKAMEYAGYAQENMAYMDYKENY